MARFVAPKLVYTGPGTISQLGAASTLPGKKVLLVAGASSARASGLYDKVLSLLSQAGAEAETAEPVTGEPDVELVDRIRERSRAFGAECMVAVGGGSVIDAAKAACGLAREQAPAREFLDGRKVTEPSLPLVACPTTSGTGAEATPNAVVSDRSLPLKRSIRSETMLPSCAIVDGELTLSCPKEITARSGADALTQAIESFTSRHATPLTEALSLKAAELLGKSLVRAVEDGSDMDARTDCAYASFLAGVALANARLGVVHGVAHPLGLKYGIPHGLVCGILLPEAMRLNMDAAREKYAVVARALDPSGEKDAVEAVEALLRAVGIPADLKEWKIPHRDFDWIVEASMPSGSLKANPLKIEERHVREMLERLCDSEGG